MQDSEKQKITDTYKTKILGIRNYQHSKNEFFVDDFLDLEIFNDFLWEVDSGESDITPAGKSFLEKYYDYDELATLLSNEVSTWSNKIEYREKILEILKDLEPMRIISFIEQARGNIDENYTLREDLLPPKDN